MRLSLTMAFCASLGLPSTAQATIIAPGETIFPLVGTTVAERPELAGTVLADKPVGPFDLEADPLFFAGEVVLSRVVENADSDLNFYAQLRDPVNASFSKLYINSVTLTGYAGVEVDAVYRADSAGDVGPTSVTRSADGDQLTFGFEFPIFVGNLLGQAQQESLFFGALTNADSYDTTGRAIITGRLPELYGDTILTAELTGLYAPVLTTPQVPLPTAGWLLIGALGGLSGLRHRRSTVR